MGSGEQGARSGRQGTRSGSRAVRETSAGGVIFRCEDDGPHFLLILDGYQNWGFPKGHIDAGESPDAAARREIEEETGLKNLVLRAPLGMIDWYFRQGDRLIHKYCHYFLFESESGAPRPQNEEGIAACQFYPQSEAVKTISYDNARKVLRSAILVVPQFCQKHREA